MSDPADIINNLTKRVLAGDQSITSEEMLAAIRALRAERGVAARTVQAKQVSKKAADDLDLDAIFGSKKE